MKATAICIEKGCDKEVKAKGRCSTHHQRWYRAMKRDLRAQNVMRIRKSIKITLPVDRLHAINGMMEDPAFWDQLLKMYARKNKKKLAN